jgi:hypothetical protein
MTIRELLATTSIPMAPAGEGGAATADDGGGDGSGDAGAGDSGGGEPGSTAATGGSTQTGTIIDHLSDGDLAQSESLQKFKSLDDLAKSYTELEKKLGANDNQGTLPEDPSKYELPNLAEDAQFQPNEEFTEEFKQKAHELGLSNEQVKALYSWYVEGVGEKEVQQMQERAQEFRDNSEAQLRKEFGNSYNERMQAAKTAVEQFGGDELKQVLDQTGLGNHPAVVKAFAEMGKQLSEDTIGGSAKGQFGRTPDEAASQIAELRQDGAFMQKYLDSRAEGHDEAVQKMNALYRDAYPDQ